MAVPISIPTNSVGSSLFCKPSPAFIVCILYDDVSCCFDLYYCINWWCWASFHVFFGPSVCLHWRNVYLDLLFFDWIFVVVIELNTLELVLSLYTWELNFLLVTSFANVFSNSVGCLFILCMLPLAVQKLLSLIRSRLFLFLFSLL